MASLYLLGNPDHYTNHKFILSIGGVCQEVLNVWDENVENLKDIPDKV